MSTGDTTAIDEIIHRFTLIREVADRDHPFHGHADVPTILAGIDKVAFWGLEWAKSIREGTEFVDPVAERCRRQLRGEPSC